MANACLTECTAGLPGQGFEGCENLEVGGVGILSTGEEEVKVAKSETPMIIGVWCKREMLRTQ